MKLTREGYLAVCQTCKKRSSTMQKGIICSLTGEHAAYEEDQCPDFELDEVAKQKIQKQTVQKVKDNKSSIIGGSVVLFLSFVWLIYGLSLGLLFIYSLVLMIAGAIILVKGVLAHKKQKEKELQPSDDILNNIL